MSFLVYYTIFTSEQQSCTDSQNRHTRSLWHLHPFGDSRDEKLVAVGGVRIATADRTRHFLVWLMMKRKVVIPELRGREIEIASADLVEVMRAAAGIADTVDRAAEKIVYQHRRDRALAVTRIIGRPVLLA